MWMAMAAVISRLGYGELECVFRRAGLSSWAPMLTLHGSWSSLTPADSRPALRGPGGAHSLGQRHQVRGSNRKDVARSCYRHSGGKAHVIGRL